MKLDTELRDLLQRKADEIDVSLAMPPPTGRRIKMRRFGFVSALAGAALVVIVGGALAIQPLFEEDEPTIQPAEQIEESGAVEVATAFAEAYGALDIEQALTYLADDADISGIGGTLENMQLEASWFEAMGYKEMLGPCEVLGSSALGTLVRCPYDFHALRSDEIGLGPFGGSFYQLSVEDGAINRASNELNFMDEFSPQMWEPFADWVSKAYPEDAEVMYTDESLTDGRLTEKSFRLWEKHSREYVKEVGQ